MDSWYPNQQCVLHHRIVCKQQASTPGMYKVYRDCVNCDLRITITGRMITKNSEIRLWVGVEKSLEVLYFGKEGEFSTPYDKTITYVYKNNRHLDTLLVGLLFVNPRSGDIFEFSAFHVDKIDRPPVDVLFLSLTDSGSSCWDICRSLRTIGLNTEMLVGRSHPFGYEEQATLFKDINSCAEQSSGGVRCSPFIVQMSGNKVMNKMIENSRFIIWHGCTKIVCEAATPEKIQRSAVLCVGRNYRLDPEVCGLHFKNCYRLIAATPDLYGINPYTTDVFIQLPINIDKYPVSYEFRNSNKLIVGHFPSNPYAKGTTIITSAIEQLENDAKYATKFAYIGIRKRAAPISWAEHIKRYQQCDVYIEAIQLIVEGKRCGTWGITCYEAAASGCIVITNQLYADLYKNEYGDCPVYIANSREEISNQLKKIVMMDRDTLLAEKKKFRKWVEDKHDYFHTATRIWSLVLQNHFNITTREKVMRFIEEKRMLKEDKEETNR